MYTPRTLKQTILTKQGKNIPNDILSFFTKGHVISRPQYNDIVKDKIQQIRTTKGCSHFFILLLSKFRSDLNDQEECLYRCVIPNVFYSFLLFPIE